MLKLRTKTNKRFKVAEDVSFIEICDKEGNLGALISINEDGSIEVNLPGERTYENYVQSFKVKRSTFIIHNPKTDND